MSFQDEFEKRLRRVCGVTDDSRTVTYRVETWSGFGGCETCGDNGAKSEIEVRVYASETERTASRDFDDLGDLMRALDAVELDVQ